MKEPAKYLVLFEKIKTEIADGVYKSGEKIPGEKELAEKYNISRQTVRQALSMLEQKALIERKQGSGTYVSEIVQKKKRTWNVGVVATYISEYIFPSILRGIESELSENGFFPVIGATKNRVDGERKILEDFMDKNMDGLIVEGTKSALPNPNADLYRKIQEKGVPVVFFNGFYPIMDNITYVIMDDKQGGMQAVQHLVEKGHENIGGIFKSDDMQGLERYSGFLQGLVNNSLPMRDEWITWFNSENRSYLFQDEAERIVASLKDCTAVVCYNDEIAIKLFNVLRTAGYHIPQDKAIISFDNSLLSEVSNTRITSFDHPKELLGAAAARKLIGMLDGRKEHSLVMQWRLVEKDSV